MALDAVAQSETLRSVLGEWVPKIVCEFALSEQVVPRCWYRHSAMIHELLALFQYRQQQQFNMELGPPVSAAIDFQYQFSLWRQRMRSLTGDAGCTASKHLAQHRPSWADSSTTDFAMWSVDLDEFARELVAFAEPDVSESSALENGEES
ncbi:hypothetical protein [Leucobacter manosquensis]|uniref:Uncharacterized protein n=1 Tax=Leucobacter manosquensis TaxID=2810611 RepID=A0ABS5M6Q6_9MICO|nr:hypothetical protein [Leucobacter manosquensis]MBS3182356.1 hypothetical protein [Leucobacter manosquensis]